MYHPSPLNIYFSIRWSKIGCDLYAKVVDHLKKYWVVLNEHVARAFTNPKKYNIAFTWADVFATDSEFLDKAEVLIAEVSQPSHGVWRELCYAQHVKHIPILGLYLPDKAISPMIAGNPYIKLMPYRTVPEGKKLIDSFLATLL